MSPPNHTLVSDAFLSIARDKMGAAGSLVVALVAHGIDHTRDWPFVTLSSFQQRALTAKRQAGALRIETNPVSLLCKRFQFLGR